MASLALRAVRRCRRLASAPGAARLVFPNFFRFFYHGSPRVVQARVGYTLINAISPPYGLWVMGSLVPFAASFLAGPKAQSSRPPLVAKTWAKIYSGTKTHQDHDDQITN